MTSARALSVALLVASTSACLAPRGRGVSATIPVPASVLMESRTVDRAVPARAGQLTPAQVDSLAPRIRALRAEPAELEQVIGDTVRIASHVRILALDSAGTVLGELSVYDFGYTGRGFRLLADGRVYLSRVGTVRFTAQLPAALWRGAPAERPSALVTLTIRRDAP